jgi:hypothetical protein
MVAKGYYWPQAGAEAASAGLVRSARAGSGRFAPESIPALFAQVPVEGGNKRSRF